MNIKLFKCKTCWLRECREQAFNQKCFVVPRSVELHVHSGLTSGANIFVIYKQMKRLKISTEKKANNFFPTSKFSRRWKRTRLSVHMQTLLQRCETLSMFYTSLSPVLRIKSVSPCATRWRTLNVLLVQLFSQFAFEGPTDKTQTSRTSREAKQFFFVCETKSKLFFKKSR